MTWRTITLVVRREWKAARKPFLISTAIVVTVVGLGLVALTWAQRDEPVRAAVGAIFATRVAEEAFLPATGGDHDTSSGSDAARATFTSALDTIRAIPAAPS